MSAEDLPYSEQGDITEEHSFDELARGMAEGTISRGRALKLVAAALVNFGSLGLLGGVAEARHRRRCGPKSCPKGCCVNGKCHVHDPQFCGSGGGLCTTCPTGDICFSGKCGTQSVKTCKYSSKKKTCSKSNCANGFGCLRTTEGDRICPCTEFSSSCTSSSQCPENQYCVSKSNPANPDCILVGGTSTCVVSC